MFLAFDPAVSRHHEVYFFPKEEQQCQEKHLMSPRTKRPEEKVFHVFVFSSRIGQWESREFRPRHSGSAHLYDVVTAPRGEDDKTWWSAEQGFFSRPRFPKSRRKPVLSVTTGIS
jgi:hypothetical protein